MRLGKTIAGERERAITESERMQERDHEKRRKTMSIAILVSVLLLGMVAVWILLTQLINSREKPGVTTEVVKYEPSIEIVDEATSSGNSEFITDSIKQYVGLIEQDLKDIGLIASRAVIPVGKSKEIDIYISGRSEYYKCNMDRVTAASAEDIMRMTRYLDEHEIKPSEYVDVRIEKRAYYK